MRFKKHFGLADRHAFLSPSSPAWSNYDEEKLDLRWYTAMNAKRGVALHALAADAIKLKVKFSGKSTIARYVNDAIGYDMEPEQTLYYSENCFGHTDAISFRRNKLKIFDLKNGITPTSMQQLRIYAALFCLEYGFKPFELAEIELRIYQSDDIKREIADPDEIFHIMDTIVMHDKRIEENRREAGL